MSLTSMTGYGQGEKQGEQYQLTVEIKSVNHRFRDIRFKMGALFLSEEGPARKKIEQTFARGSFDIYINYKALEKTKSKINIDHEKVIAFLKQSKEIATASGVDLNIAPDLFLRSDFANLEDNKDVELRELFKPAFDEALKELKEKRDTEGLDVTKEFESYIASYEKEVATVVKQKEGFRPFLQARMEKRLKESGLEIENSQERLLQEIIFYLEKWDVDEEISRITTHLTALSGLLNTATKKTAGRKIEFLLQELGRETNTIGSKSHNTEISQAVVEMKVFLEKMREQAANVE